MNVHCVLHRRHFLVVSNAGDPQRLLTYRCVPRSSDIRLFLVLIRASCRGQTLDKPSSIARVAPSLSLRPLVVVSRRLTRLEALFSFQTLARTGWTSLFPRLDTVSTGRIVVVVIVVIFSSSRGGSKLWRSPTFNHALILSVSIPIYHLDLHRGTGQTRYRDPCSKTRTACRCWRKSRSRHRPHRGQIAPMPFSSSPLFATTSAGPTPYSRGEGVP